MYFVIQMFPCVYQMWISQHIYLYRTCADRQGHKSESIVRLKEQSRPSLSNVTSGDVSLTTPLNSATSLVNVMKSV